MDNINLSENVVVKHEIGEVFFENGKKRDKMSQKSEASYLKPPILTSGDKITFTEENDTLDLIITTNDTLDTKTMSYPEKKPQVINSRRIKQETFEEDLESDIVCLKSRSRILFKEDIENLYENHTVKEELVIGPEIIQGVNCNTHLPGKNLVTSDEQTISDTKCKPKNSYRCYRCGKVLSYESIFEKHLHLQTCVRLFTCDYCQENFDNRSKIVSHLKSHVKHGHRQRKKENIKKTKGPNRNLCHKKFHLKPSLESSMKSHKKFDKKGNMCELCGNNFASLQNLRRHKSAVHDGIKPFNCQICSKSYTRKRDFVYHQAKEHDSSMPVKQLKEIHCKYCNKNFFCRSNCNRHEKYSCTMNNRKIVRSTQGERNYTWYTTSTCDICQKSYKQKDSLIRHMKNHLGTNVTHSFQSYTCDICGKHYKHKKILRCHIQKKHLYVKLIPCDNCKQKFSCNWYLLDHRKRCLLKNKCNFCERAIIGKEKFTKHMQMHVGTKPIYECDVCHWVYLSKGALMWHLRIKHMNIREFTCDKCKSTFTRKLGLDRHNRNSCPYKKLC